MTTAAADRLDAVLEEERRKIIALETDSLEVLESEKGQLFDELMREADHALLRSRLPNILSKAQINAALLAEAVEAMAELFGLASAGTYDRSAKKGRAARAGRRRAI